MNDEMQRELIKALLDKYERSSFFRTGTASTKRILLKLYENGKCEFSDYDNYTIQQAEKEYYKS